MKKFFCGVVKFFTILTILAALAYTCLLYTSQKGGADRLRPLFFVSFDE